MAHLIHLKRNQILSSEISVADTLYLRTKGLLGKTLLLENEMLWILRCNSIHTFFMKFSIDCVFLDKNSQVCAVRSHIRPWRIVLPIRKACSVIEMKVGKARTLNLQIGDLLHVGN